MRRTGNFQTSRYVTADDASDRIYTVWIDRSETIGARFRAGLVTLRPSRAAKEAGARFRKARMSDASALADELNARDVEASRG